MQFELLAQRGEARLGRLTLAHGVVETPIFMPCGTYGSVKGVSQTNFDRQAFRYCWVIPFT